MPIIRIPLTTYRISENKPNQKWGSPKALPVAEGHRVLCKVPIDRVPADGTIVSATLQFYADRNDAGGDNIRVLPVTSNWRAGVTWATQPDVGSVLDTDTTAAVSARDAMPGLDVTAWASTRDRRGLCLRSTTANGSKFWVRGSSGENSQPVLIVEYTTVPDTSGNQRPSGGSVSVASPILTYAGADDMTAQRIQYSTTGDSGDIDYDSGWLAAVEGYFDPALEAGTEPVLTDGGAGIWWRVSTDGPEGPSVYSDWAYYEYNTLPDVTITNPSGTTDDGSPPLTWTVEDDRQTAWRAEYWNGSTLIASSGWAAEPATRTWTPDKNIPVPGGSGRFILWVRDDITPRVAATNAPTEVRVVEDFTTVLSGAGTAIDTLTVTFEDPIPVLEGTRSLGVPDEVSLFRDGVQVPIWTEDGTVYPAWAPGSEFFDGDDFRIVDYTAQPRTTPVWSVRVKVGGVTSAIGPTVSLPIATRSVWLVNPRTDERVEVQGYNGLPAVEQNTVENSILHTPLNGDLIVEPKRRRLIRTTRFGALDGVVLNDDEGILDEWVNAESANKYRLIFGKVNWSVILGDYSPQDVFYQIGCDDNMIVVTMNWWQRLSDV